MTETLTTFEGGATRTEQEGRYDLIPEAAIDAIARRVALGAKKHGENNWRNGGREFAKACISHGMKHLVAYAESGQQDDLDGAICNLAFLCHFHKLGFVPGGKQVDMCTSVGQLADGRAAYTCHEDKGHAGPHRCGQWQWSDEAPTMRVAVSNADGAGWVKSKFVDRNVYVDTCGSSPAQVRARVEAICKLFRVDPEQIGLTKENVRITEVPESSEQLEGSFFDIETWKMRAAVRSENVFAWPCYLGVSGDFCVALFFAPLGDEPMHVWAWHAGAEEAVERRLATGDVRGVGFDALYNCRALARDRHVAIPQNAATLSPAMRRLQSLIASGGLLHEGDPVLTLSLESVAARADTRDRVYPRKRSSSMDIDCALALLNALALIDVNGVPSRWEVFAR